jgi:polysaccharide biosynthesis/export protein
MRALSLFCFLCTIIAFSCTPQKIAISNYLERTTDTLGKNIVNLKPPVIEKGDILSIKVYSNANGLQPEVDAPYNLPVETASSNASGYLVDRNGSIEYPRLGVLQVEGYTREELASLIKSRLDTVLTNPVVVVRFMNFKISVLGEVKAPGSYTFPTENVTILDVLGSSGDITDFGKKDKVRIIREKNGKIENGFIDLTSDSMFVSPYYRLYQGDVVIVDPNRRKARQLEQQELITRIGIASSVVTAIALILNFIK